MMSNYFHIYKDKCFIYDAASSQDCTASIAHKWNKSINHWWNKNNKRRPNYSEKHLSLSLCLPQIPHWLGQDRTRAYEVRSQPATTSVSHGTAICIQYDIICLHLPAHFLIVFKETAQEGSKVPVLLSDVVYVTVDVQYLWLAECWKWLTDCATCLKCFMCGSPHFQHSVLPVLHRALSVTVYIQGVQLKTEHRPTVSLTALYFGI